MEPSNKLKFSNKPTVSTRQMLNTIGTHFIHISLCFTFHVTTFICYDPCLACYPSGRQSPAEWCPHRVVNGFDKLMKVYQHCSILSCKTSLKLMDSNMKEREDWKDVTSVTHGRHATIFIFLYVLIDNK